MYLYFIFLFFWIYILFFFLDTKVNLANKTKQKLERTNQIKPGKTYGGRNFLLDELCLECLSIPTSLLLNFSPTTYPIGSNPSPHFVLMFIYILIGLIKATTNDKSRFDEQAAESDKIYIYIIYRHNSYIQILQHNLNGKLIYFYLCSSLTLFFLTYH